MFRDVTGDVIAGRDSWITARQMGWGNVTENNCRAAAGEPAVAVLHVGHLTDCSWDHGAQRLRRQLEVARRDWRVQHARLERGD